MAQNTTIVFVPGAWHPGCTWASVASLCEKAGYNTTLVELASVGPKEHLTDIWPDVNAIRQAIQNAIAQEQRVVVVVHSYGGVPASQAVQGLRPIDLADDKVTSKEIGVVHLIYCCSFVIDEGQTLTDAMGGTDPPWYLVSEDKKEVRPAKPEVIFYNDMSASDTQAAIARLKPFSYQTVNSTISYVGWKHIPTSYIYCTKDQAMPLEVQKMMVEQTAKGFDFYTETIEASHSPMLSRPEETASAIVRAIQR